MCSRVCVLLCGAMMVVQVVHTFWAAFYTQMSNARTADIGNTTPTNQQRAAAVVSLLRLMMFCCVVLCYGRRAAWLSRSVSVAYSCGDSPLPECMYTRRSCAACGFGSVCLFVEFQSRLPDYRVRCAVVATAAGEQVSAVLNKIKSILSLCLQLKRLYLTAVQPHIGQSAFGFRLSVRFLSVPIPTRHPIRNACVADVLFKTCGDSSFAVSPF